VSPAFRTARAIRRHVDAERGGRLLLAEVEQEAVHEHLAVALVEVAQGGVDGVALADGGSRVVRRRGLGPQAAIARPVFRRVPTEELDETVERLLSGWLTTRREKEDFRSFCDRTSDEELGTLAGREPARTREEREAA